jgi:hypothetical protein
MISKPLIAIIRHHQNGQLFKMRLARTLEADFPDTLQGFNQYVCLNIQRLNNSGTLMVLLKTLFFTFSLLVRPATALLNLQDVITNDIFPESSSQCTNGGESTVFCVLNAVNMEPLTPRPAAHRYDPLQL